MLCALSGGVDSAVAAALVHKAIGDQLTCVFVDTGLMRASESEQVEETFRRQFHVDLVHVKAADRFFEALAGVTEPEAQAQDHRRAVHPDLRGGGPRPGGREGRSRRRRRRRTSPPATWSRAPSTPTSSSRARARRPPSSPTTTWAACPTTWPSTWSSPCASCSRTRSGRSARSSGLPHEIVWRQPFPGPGLAVRIVGEVTPERADILRAADAIVVEEIRRAGLYRELWQSFAVLPAVRTVGSWVTGAPTPIRS